MNLRHKKLILIITSVILFVLFFKPFEKTETNNGVTKRIRIKIFGKTFYIADIVKATGFKTSHIFDYCYNVAYQFQNGAYTQKMGLYDVQ